MQTFDYIVVGSGCSAAIAAQTLVEAGKQVVMIDVGETNPTYKSLVPNKDYLSLRTKDPEQYKYFIGEQAEGVVVNDTGKGAQITPTRNHLVRNTDAYIPLSSSTFEPIESLGYGGLGIGWGLQCWEFSKSELSRVGMNVERTLKAYETVARKIGISATKDAASAFTLGELQTYQHSPTMDRNMQRIHDKYLQHKRSFDHAGVYLGRTPLALLTEPKSGRKPYAYRDMDFYDDNGKSAWRPWVTVDMLKKKPNFTYINGFLATHFSETDKTTVIHGINTTTQKPIAYSCKKLILATGALGTARIALRSFGGAQKDSLPFLCNPYTYVPCVQPAMFGKGPEPRKIGFGQLSAFLGNEAQQDDSSILTLYSYQSLMLFRIIRQAPLNFADARPIMQYLSSGLIVTGIQHSDKHTDSKSLRLRKNTNSLTDDELHADFVLSDEEIKGQRNREDQYLKAMRKTGIYPIKRIQTEHGSSVHYAGTLPFSKTEKRYHLDSRGKLYGTRNVYVADSSGFQFLPARGLTFTILANAHITAENVLTS
jgi:choline dehydrogenase-like flavoprotein